jgi:hypothetical protein
MERYFLGCLFCFILGVAVGLLCGSLERALLKHQLTKARSGEAVNAWKLKQVEQEQTQRIFKRPV